MSGSVRLRELLRVGNVVVGVRQDKTVDVICQGCDTWLMHLDPHDPHDVNWRLHGTTKALKSVARRHDRLCPDHGGGPLLAAARGRTRLF